MITNEIGDKYFSILVDESCHKSIKKQMSQIMLFLNKQGQVIERFLGVEDVSDTLAFSLKCSLNNLFDHYDLSFSKLKDKDMMEPQI